MNNYFKPDHRILRPLTNVCIKPIIITVNNFGEPDVKTFAQEMSDAHDTGQSIIPIVIDSYGGFVDGLMGMVACIQTSKLPVATICEGKAMSAGATLLSCGTQGYRFISPYARIMIHEISSGNRGKISELKVSTDESLRLNNMMFKLIANNCGQESDWFLRKMMERNNTDWYMGPEEAKKIGLINHIVIPEMITEITVKNELKW